MPTTGGVYLTAWSTRSPSGILPLAAARFLGWILIKSAQDAPASQNWSLADILLTGVLVMLAARYGLRSVFCHPREVGAR